MILCTSEPRNDEERQTANGEELKIIEYRCETRISTLGMYDDDIQFQLSDVFPLFL